MRVITQQISNRYTSLKLQRAQVGRLLLPSIAALRLWIVLLLIASASAHAAGPALVSWDDLVPSVAPYDDPFAAMSFEEKSDLRQILLARDGDPAADSDSALHDAAEAARGRLEARGFDADVLLEQRLVVMERRREEATGVTAAFLDHEVSLDGYALPLAWEDGRVVEFFLVPWVGACIHTPPPPPNQIVHVIYPSGLSLERQFEPIRLSGRLTHDPKDRTLFLVDGSRQIPVSYALEEAQIGGAPGEIIATSAESVPALARLQIWINTLFTSGMTAIEGDGSVTSILWAVLLAFGYGVLHTLGPGHGKAVVVSYFVGTGGGLQRGLTMGIRIAVFHVLSAVLVVFLLDFAVRQTTGTAPSDFRAIRLASYGLIVLIGAYMLWQAMASRRVRHAVSAAAHAHHLRHDHGHSGCAACDATSAQSGSGWLAAAVGSVPCTGALLVMLFGLANDLVMPAILMVVAISLGMAVSMSAIGIAALWGRDWAERRFGVDHDRRSRFEIGARLAGSSCVLVLGVLLIWLTLTHEPVMQNPHATVAQGTAGGGSQGDESAPDPRKAPTFSSCVRYAIARVSSEACAKTGRGTANTQESQGQAGKVGQHGQ